MPDFQRIERAKTGLAILALMVIFLGTLNCIAYFFEKSKTPVPKTNSYVIIIP